ncbi:protein containing diguanylate cyclase (GGDEF) domain [Bellilinea caldifistulae]|uniref:tetratricopeptide repeat-containing diguanylate cyclase n=1 Tax=Bellilinea caldifistulae TaxID=360411 RepID=UPI0007802FA0|nr:diguanylate cyclase [Bellilinea caldifistulae]GAP10830.1 protein containing diguanylate cyclase (GGDEF) domain [Bellilinea caldifistulae]
MSEIQPNQQLELNPNATAQKIEALLRRTGPLTQSNPKRALELAREAARLAGENAPSSLEHRKVLGRALIAQGKALLELDAYDQAIPCYISALECFNPAVDSHETAEALLGLGSGMMIMGSYPEALQYLMRALSAFQNLKNQSGEAAVRVKLGKLYLLLGEAEKALPHLETALDLAQYLTDLKLEAPVQIYLSQAFSECGRHQNAVQAGLRGVEIYQNLGIHRGEVEALNTLGEVYFRRNEFGLALNFFHLSADVAKKFDKRLELARAHRKIGIIHLSMGNISAAVEALQSALTIASEINAQYELMECHHALAQAYKKTENYPKALEAYENYIAVYQIVYNEEKDRRLKTLEVIHEVENARKDAEIYQLKNVALQKEIEERKKAQAALERLATQDSLTGIANRRYFLEIASRLIEQACRYHRPVSLVMIDVDHFKEMNDTFGHKTGDKVLIQITRSMQAVLRKVDILGRYGGDEFVILLPETTPEGARRMTERLKQAVAQQPVTAGGVSIPITLSIGLASNVKEPDLSLDELLQRADRALYDSKMNGRDRITFYE